MMKEFAPNIEGHMCSYDIVSLFTNMPLEETIGICTKALYHSDEPLPPLKEKSFKKLIHKVTTGVEFSFNETMYQQIDGVAIGSPLGPVLANPFVGYQEQRLKITSDADLLLYRRYVDDTFSYHTTHAHSEEMLTQLNALHPALRFTREHEVDNKLPFLDVMSERKYDLGRVWFSTSVFRNRPSRDSTHVGTLSVRRFTRST